MTPKFTALSSGKTARNPYHWPLLSLGIVLLSLFGISLTLGSVAIPLSAVGHILTGQSSQNAIWSDIIWQLRLPRSLTALFAGAALAVSGLQMQTLFQNPLADSGILGINAGASLGVAIVLLSFRFTHFLNLTPWQNSSILFSASLGSALTLTLMLILSQHIRNTVRLLIFGLMFGYIASAVVTLLLQFSTLTETQAYLNWTFGSFAGVNWAQLPLLMTAIALGLTIAQFLAPHLNVLSLGEEVTQSLGGQMGIIRLWIILSTALLSGTVTAFCGPIAFLGIAVPHFCRQLFHRVDHYFLVPANALLGGILALIADALAQLPGRSETLPLSSVTIIIGAPAVIWIILKQQSFVVRR